MNGAMAGLVTDGASEKGAKMGQNKTTWRKVIEDFLVKHKLSGPYSQWRNKAEGEIREINRRMWKELLVTRAPKRLWCFLRQNIAARRRLIALNIPRLHGRVPAERRLGFTPGISAEAQFSWYERCLYIDHKVEGRQPGRVLDVAESYQADMMFWILKPNGAIIARQSVYNLAPEEERNPTIVKLFEDLDKSVEERIGNNATQADIEKMNE